MTIRETIGLQGQLLRLTESVASLLERVNDQQKTINAQHDIIVDMAGILAGLAEQDQSLYERIQRLESRRIHLYLDEDSNPCIGHGDWQDRLESFGSPRDFADELQENDFVKGDEEDKD